MNTPFALGMRDEVRVGDIVQSGEQKPLQEEFDLLELDLPEWDLLQKSGEVANAGRVFESIDVSDRSGCSEAANESGI